VDEFVNFINQDLHSFKQLNSMIRVLAHVEVISELFKLLACLAEWMEFGHTACYITHPKLGVVYGIHCIFLNRVITVKLRGFA
jgi:hypothetical protein